MEKRNLGNNETKISPIILGGNVFGWTIDEKQSFKILDAFLDAGFNCIDTADMYSNWVDGNKGGESEEIIGKWISQRKNRDKIVLATKVGMEFRGKNGLKKDYILNSIEGSLKRLQTDYVDLYQAHQDDKSTPILESLEAFTKLKQSGKVKVIGASNYEGVRFKEALELAKKNDLEIYQTMQPQYNLFDRSSYESDLEEICSKNNISVISYYSLASGFLTGKYRSEKDLNKSPRGSGIKDHYLNSRGEKILKALDEVSEDLGATLAQVSLAWLLHRPSITAPIVSATKIEQLEDIIKATEIKLTQTHLDKLNNASAY